MRFHAKFEKLAALWQCVSTGQSVIGQCDDRSDGESVLERTVLSFVQVVKLRYNEVVPNCKRGHEVFRADSYCHVLRFLFLRV